MQRNCPRSVEGVELGFNYLKQLAEERQCATIYSFSLLRTVLQESAWSNILQ
jgi:hypothetical protein